MRFQRPADRCRSSRCRRRNTSQAPPLLTIQLAPEKIAFPPELDPNKWFVRGRVTTPYGEAVRATVSAAAISLKGEAPLGQVQTSETGRYEIVYEWDDSCLPDVQVTASREDKPIAQSPIRFAAGKSVRIDLVSGDEPVIGPTEFQTVEERVRRCGDFDVAGIGEKQFDYLLGKTRLAAEKLNVLPDGPQTRIHERSARGRVLRLVPRQDARDVAGPGPAAAGGIAGRAEQRRSNATSSTGDLRARSRRCSRPCGRWPSPAL